MKFGWPFGISATGLAPVTINLRRRLRSVAIDPFFAALLIKQVPQAGKLIAD